MPPYVPPYVIAIDGVSSSGKGTLARNLASKLDYAYLDTGTLYRCFGLKAASLALDTAHQEIISDKAKDIVASINKDDLKNPQIKSDVAAMLASQISAYPAVRAALLNYQRDFAAHEAARQGKTGVILDGRDIGTVICPDANLKLFLTATPEIRAQRRMKELQSAGIACTFGSVFDQMMKRDQQDQQRSTAPTLPAHDALILDSSHHTADEMLQQVLTILEKRCV
jgi:cytidylate kinase